jgi:hypothetical protein
MRASVHKRIIHHCPSSRVDSESRTALTEFADDVGIPDSLLSDGAPKLIGPRTDFMKEVSL